MRSWTWFRALAVLLALFAAGHTVGTAAPHVTRGAPEAAVFDAMQSFRFPIMGFNRTYWDFYRGLAITVSVLMVALTVMAWQVGSIAKRGGRTALPMAITLQCACVAMLVIGYVFLFGGPIVFSAAAVVLSTIATIAVAREPARVER
jgi:hypothetical protein